MTEATTIPTWKVALFGRKKVSLGRSLMRILVALFLCLGAIVLFAFFYIRQPSLRSSPPSSAEVEPAVLERHVRVLSEELVPRHMYHLGNTRRTALYIQKNLDAVRGAAGRPSEQVFEVPTEGTYRNVGLVLAPDAPGKRIVVGAHYDAYQDYPGADDNASGVAGGIELARLLAPLESEFVRPVELVFYPREEPPAFGGATMGSGYHARAMKKAGVGCELMVCIEMIGYFTDEPGSQTYPVRGLSLFYPGRGNFIGVVGNTEYRESIRRFKVAMKGTTPMPVYSISAHPQLPGIDFSDHRNYWMAGMPAIMVTDTAFYRNFHYHTEEDTADKLDYERMSQVVVGLFEAIRTFASE